MAVAKWKFKIAHSEGVLGDIAEALRASGFSFSESATMEEALLDTSELYISFKKESDVDPWVLSRNLEQAGLEVHWKNKPER